MFTGAMNGDIGCRSEIAVGSPSVAWGELHTPALAAWIPFASD
jgi:hypothetical protein